MRPTAVARAGRRQGRRLYSHSCVVLAGCSAASLHSLSHAEISGGLLESWGTACGIGERGDTKVLSFYNLSAEEALCGLIHVG